MIARVRILFTLDLSFSYFSMYLFLSINEALLSFIIVAFLFLLDSIP